MWSTGRTVKFKEPLRSAAQDVEKVGLTELRSAVNQLAGVDIEAVCDVEGGVGNLTELMHRSPMRSRYGGDGALRTEAPAPTGGVCGKKDCWTTGKRRTRYRDRKLARASVKSVVLRATKAGARIARHLVLANGTYRSRSSTPFKRETL